MSTILETAKDLGQEVYTKTEIDTITNGKVTKIATSTDNAIVRFDGTSGQVQNSSVVIDDSGNVGIGTTSPSEKLSVSSNATYHLSIKSTADSSYAAFGAIGDNLLIYNNGSERMRIDSSGNLLVGTTTDNGVDKLQVNGSIKSNDRQKFSGSIAGNGSISFNLDRNVNAIIQYQTTHNAGDSRAYIGMLHNNWTTTNLTQIALNDLGSVSVSHSVSTSSYDAIFTLTNTSTSAIYYDIIISSTSSFYKI